MSKFDFDKSAANHMPLTPISFITRTAMMYGSHDAVIYGDRRYTWAQTYARCCQFASALKKRGIGKGDTVSVISANTPEMVEAHFAVPMSGAVLNTINTRLDADTISYIFEHGEAKVVIIDAELSPTGAEAVASLPKDVLVIDILDLQNSEAPAAVGSIDYEAFLAEGDADDPWEMPADEWDALALNYTSGSTGRPKGVVYHHRGGYLMAQGTISDWGMPRHPKYLYIVPMFHCNGWNHAWAVAALAGTIICTRTITPELVYDAIDVHGVTHFGGAPIVLGMIVNADETARKPFDHKVEVMTAGAPPPAAVLEAFEALGFNVTHVYGLTETYGHTVMSSWNPDWNDLPVSERSDLKARQGAGMVHSEVMIADKDGKPVPKDGETIGEIYIKGHTIMKGYLKNEEATKEAFEGGWFHSGDLAVWYENGYVAIKDRLKDIIISGGENVSSVEVEGVLHRHPSVALAAVVAKPDDKWGEVPCAFVELKDGATAEEAEVIEFCRENLAGFKTPKEVVFGELPKTATGKIQKFELRKRF